MASRRKSLLDSTRNSNFLRRSFGATNQIDQLTLTREEYLLHLQKEKVQWKNLRKQKKREAEKKAPEIVINADDYTIINDEDKKFLQEKPNYLEIAQDARGFVQKVLYHNARAEEWKKCFELVEDDMDEKRDAIVSQLLDEEKQLCKICNNGFCTTEIHPLADGNISDVMPDLNSLHLNDDS